MSAAISRIRYTPAEYLTLERDSEIKHELVSGEVYAMAGASPAHNRIVFNLATHLGVALLGGECQGYSSDQRVRVPETDMYSYPDLTIVCGEPAYDPHDSETLVNPTLLVEVLSPSTEAWDRGGKFEYYRRLTSLKEYLLVSQDRPLVERYVRQGPTGAEWLYTAYAHLDEVLTLDSLGVELPVVKIYDRISFPDRSRR